MEEEFHFMLNGGTANLGGTPCMGPASLFLLALSAILTYTHYVSE